MQHFYFTPLKGCGNRNYTNRLFVNIRRELRLIYAVQGIYVILKIRQNRSCTGAVSVASLCQKLIDRKNINHVQRSW